MTRRGGNRRKGKPNVDFESFRARDKSPSEIDLAEVAERDYLGLNDHLLSEWHSPEDEQAFGTL